MGNTLSKNGLNFTYNKQGRLTSASTVGMNAAYLYNYKGERVSKQVEGVTTQFIYNLNGQLISEADSTGAITKEYIYLNGQRFASVIGNTLYYVHTDHLGTPIALTDEAGAVQWKASYTPFGKAIVEVNNIAQDIRFPGQYFDQETNLHYNYFRDYDPEIGRYIQSDPIGLNGGINTYGYVLGNPINGIDPFGLATYRYPGNRYVDHQLPGIGGCEKPIYAGGHIVGWTPCFDEEDDCDDSDSTEIDNSYQPPTLMPWPEEPPYEPPYDPWREEFHDFFDEVNRQRDIARNECLTHTGVGMAQSKGVEIVAEHGLSRMGFSRAAAAVPVIGEFVLAFEIASGLQCVIRYPF